MTASNSRPVFSCSQGRLCPRCGQADANCQCRKTETRSPGDGIVRILRQTKGRKGKGVTLISGIPLAGESLKEFAKKLKQRCGAGGAVKDGIIEIQGDHRDLLLEELKKEGWTVKKAGG